MFMTSRLDYKNQALPVRQCHSRLLSAGVSGAMDISYCLICAMMITLCLRPSANPLTAAQDQVMKTTPAAGRSVILVLNQTHVRTRSNRSRAAHEPHLDTRVKNTKSPRKKHPSNRSERRKICFGFKMDRISDLSGMGCKSD